LVFFAFAGSRFLATGCFFIPAKLHFFRKIFAGTFFLFDACRICVIILCGRVGLLAFALLKKILTITERKNV
jgi:hypothetical protein